MKIYIGSDHAGFEQKRALAEFLRGLGYDIEDLGPHTLNNDDDYPDFVIPLAKRVVSETGSMGIILGGSGQGEAMAANRIAGARAAVYYGHVSSVQMDREGEVLDLLTSTRAHNNANILSLGARFLSDEETRGAVVSWLQTPFSENERHIRRIHKLDA